MPGYVPNYLPVEGIVSGSGSELPPPIPPAEPVPEEPDFGIMIADMMAGFNAQMERLQNDFTSNIENLKAQQQKMLNDMKQEALLARRRQKAEIAMLAKKTNLTGNKSTYSPSPGPGINTPPGNSLLGGGPGGKTLLGV